MLEADNMLEARKNDADVASQAFEQAKAEKIHAEKQAKKEVAKKESKARSDVVGILKSGISENVELKVPSDGLFKNPDSGIIPEEITIKRKGSTMSKDGDYMILEVGDTVTLTFDSLSLFITKIETVDINNNTDIVFIIKTHLDIEAEQELELNPTSEAYTLKKGQADILRKQLGIPKRVELGEDITFTLNGKTITIMFASVLIGTTTFDSTNVCLLEGTKIKVDTIGEVPIERLRKGMTIAGYPIKGYTRGEYEGRMIEIKKDSFSKNIPNKDTYITPEHSILINNKLVCAHRLVSRVKGINYVPNDNKRQYIVYNVLCSEWITMEANGLPVESLHPKFDKKNILITF